MHYLNEEHIFTFLIEIFILLGLAKGLGEVFRRFKQPTLTAELLVGILLGPTILGRFFPEFQLMLFPQEPLQRTMLETVSWFGVLFLLLETGLEIDFSSAWRQRGEALKIALSDIVIPMMLAFTAFSFLPDVYLPDPDQRLTFVLFMATAMTISAMPIAARALHDLKLNKTDLGYLVMSALSVNDIIGWLIFTVVLGLFTQVGNSLVGVFVIFASTIGFTVLCLTGGRTFANFCVNKIQEKRMPEPGSSLTFICLLGALCGAITHKIGIHALFGFFLAGIMAGEAKALSEKTRQVISQMVYAIFVPLFFASIGLKIDFLTNFEWKLVLLVIVVGISGRFIGAWFGVTISKAHKSNRLPIAIAHTPGGMMEIVIGLLALEYNLITEQIFIAIICGSITSSVLLGPWLNWAIKRRKNVSIMEFFSPRLLVTNMKARGRDDAILELCEIAAEQIDAYKAPELFDQVMQREKEMGTAVEEGIALPHAHLKHLRKPYIVFGRSTSGIEWNSPDGKPAEFIFLLLTPKDSNDVQVQILRHIVKVLEDAATREQLKNAKEKEQIWNLIKKKFSSHRIERKKR